MLTARQLAVALGGDICGQGVVAPGPGHSRRDRSLSVRPSTTAPDGFVVTSFAGDDWRECRDYIRARVGLDPDGWRKRGSLIDTAAAKRRAAAERADWHDRERRKARARALWAEASDPRGTVVETYLNSRGLELADDVAAVSIRVHSACPWRDESTGEVIRVPAMLAAMRHVETDELTAVHRTRLSPEGRKIDRRMLGIAERAALRLDPVLGDSLVIGEGVETCLAARQLGFEPAWALGSVGAIADLPVLAGISTLTILEERDANGASARAAGRCGARWHAAGRKVLTALPRIGSDMADTLAALEAK